MALDDILIKIGAKDQASAVFGKVGDNVDRFGKRFSKTSDGVVGSTKRMLTGFKGLAAGVGILATLRAGMNKLNDLDNLGKTAEKLGLTVNELVALRHAANQFSGVANTTVDMALQRMVRKVSEAAAGIGDAKEAIRELGLDARKLNEAGTSQAFGMIADAIRRVDNDADRLRLTIKFLDSEGGALVTTLDKGSAELRKMAQESRRLNGDLSEANIDGIEKMNDSVDNLGKAFGSLGTELAFTLNPLSAFVNELAEVLSIARELANTSVSGVLAQLFPVRPAGDITSAGFRKPITRSPETEGQSNIGRTIMDFIDPLGAPGRKPKKTGSVHEIFGLATDPANSGAGPFTDIFALEDSLRDPLQRMLDSLPKYDPFEDIFPADRARPFFDKLRQQMRNALPKRDRAAEFSPILARNMQAKRARQEAIEMFGPGVFESPSQRPELGAVESRLLSGRSADSKTLEESRKQTKELREIRDLAREEKRRAQAEKQLDRLIVELAGE